MKEEWNRRKKQGRKRKKQNIKKNIYEKTKDAWKDKRKE